VSVCVCLSMRISSKPLSSIAFGTHTKTAEPIEMPFRMMSRVDPRYRVLDGDPIQEGERAIFGENVTAHRKAMGHSMVSCAKTAEPIEMLFWMKTRVDPRYHVLDGVQIYQAEGVMFRGCRGHSNASAIFRCGVCCYRE